MKFFLLAAVFLAAVVIEPATANAADDAATEAAKDHIVKALGVTRENIRPAPVAGLFEVQHEHDFGYVSADGKYLFRGDLINIDTGEQVTENRRRADRLVAIKELGAKSFIEFAPPAPIAIKYTVTVFTDVDCGYCRKLHSEMADYNAKGIAIRYAFFPRSGPDTESWRSAEAVWCSSDRQTALTQAKQGAKIKLKGKTCDNPVAKEYQLGLDIGIRGTPMLLFPNGDIYPGYVSPAALAEKLAQSDAEAKPKAKS